MNKHAPLKRSLENKSVSKTNLGSPKECTHQSTSIKRKLKMYKTHYINGYSNEKYFYKRYANMLTRIKNLAKQLYIHHKLEESKNNPKKRGIYYSPFYFSTPLFPLLVLLQ